jgi:hypothetical protein
MPLIFKLLATGLAVVVPHPADIGNYKKLHMFLSGRYHLG